MVSHAIVRQPESETFNFQHNDYVAALKQCGLSVIEVRDTPDIGFIEDIALLTPQCAILTKPINTETILPLLQDLYEVIEIITPPGLVETKDILQINDHYYISLSEHTNRHGAEQLLAILERYHFDATILKPTDKSYQAANISYLHNGSTIQGHILTADSLHQDLLRSDLEVIQVPADERPAAKCIAVNGTIVMPEGYPKTRLKIEAAGYHVTTVNISEFEKLNGNVCCLSLRF